MTAIFMSALRKRIEKPQRPTRGVSGLFPDFCEPKLVPHPPEIVGGQSPATPLGTGYQALTGFDIGDLYRLITKALRARI